MMAIRSSKKLARAKRKPTHSLKLESLESRIALHGDAVDEFDVLIFSRTTGFRHGSISKGIDTIAQLGLDNGFHTTATEDAAIFNDTALDEFEAVVFMNTTGNVLNNSQQQAFERFVQDGGGYVGVHSAADTEYGWSWYGDLVGAYFQSHPSIQTATVQFEDRVHPATADLPERWTVREEWYNYQTNPRSDVHVLATLDESTYSGGNMGYDHPIAWAHDFDGGRAFYTGLGHVEAVYDTTEMQQHLLGGIQYAAGQIAVDVGATSAENFRKVTLDEQTSDPMELDVSSDGRVFYAERGGRVKMYDPSVDATSLVGNVSVSQGGEDGLLGLALDPDFENNGHVFLYYSASSEPVSRLSRFTVESDNTFSSTSEVVLLETPTTNQCCHSGGSLQFGPGGLLHLSTGDQTNPFESGGYAPIDEGAGREIYDAQRTAANSNDYRGKILRIKPESDGTYSIPEGNLFPADGSQGLPEIFVMGNRNPFRISVDSETGWVYWGEVGPDAGNADSQRGPSGYDEVNQAKAAGNFGWPHFAGDNEPYRDWNFQGGGHGDFFDPSTPVNDSPNNTGASILPPAQPAMIWYPYGGSEEFPEVGNGGRTAMAGPVYHYDASLDSDVKLPEYYDDTLFIYEWVRGWIQEVKLDAEGNFLAINPMFTGLNRPMDMEMGPDGAIYLLEWGSSFGGGNTDSLLSRIEYTGGPSVQATSVIGVDVDSGSVPLTVAFSGANSTTTSGGPLSYEWDFDLDGTVDSTDESPNYTYDSTGNFTARLTVTDPSSGLSDASTIDIFAGNHRPNIEILSPVDGQFFDWGDEIAYELQVTDAEDGSSVDGTIPPSDIVVQPLLGHDSHAHPQDIYNAFSGTFVAPDAGHGGNAADLFLAMEARYEDNGAPDVDMLSAIELRVLQLRRQEAEYAEQISGLDETGNGRRLGSFDAGDYFSFSPIHLSDVNTIRYQLRGAVPGATIEVRLDSPDGELLATHSIDVAGTSHFDAPIIERASTHEVFFVVQGNQAQLGFLEVDWVYFSDGTDLVEPEPDTILYRVNTGGPTIPAIDGSIDWEADTANSVSNYLIEPGSNSTSGFNILEYAESVDVATTPGDIFLTERWESGGGEEMQYSFPADQPGLYEVRLYVGNGWGGTASPGQRIYSVEVEGNVPSQYQSIDLSDTFGHLVGGMISYTVSVSDGSLDLLFLHELENPLVNGIEILKPETPPDAALYRLNAAGGTVDAIDDGIDWVSDVQSPYLLDAGSNGLSGFLFDAIDASVDQNTTPFEIFESERWDAGGGSEITYSFPIERSGEYEVRLYVGNGWDGTSDEGQRVFSVAVEGEVPTEFQDIDLSGTFGHSIGAVLSYNAIVTDGALDLEFLHQVENPLVNGIEIMGRSTTPARLAGDANEDGEVGFADFLLLSAMFGKQADAVWADGDFDADGTVSFADFLILSGNFGKKS